MLIKKKINKIKNRKILHPFWSFATLIWLTGSRFIHSVYVTIPKLIDTFQHERIGKSEIYESIQICTSCRPSLALLSWFWRKWVPLCWYSASNTWLICLALVLGILPLHAIGKSGIASNIDKLSSCQP